MGNFFYTLIIYPIIQIIEFTFMLFETIFKNSGVAVIGVSLAVSILCLPLYIVAEKWQQIQRNTEKKLEKGVQRIKSVFKGDEQYMILSVFYKENHYHPIMALRSSFGLLIQIPFFMAAYSFLSNLSMLQGESFLFIKDMGRPDAIFSIGKFQVNILPVIMTLINVIASAIYTKGFKFKDKATIYAMALVFLVILYPSPSGLVVYWTMNNIFSLVKNIFYKIKNPLKALYVILCVCVISFDIFILFIHEGLLHKRILIFSVCTLLLVAPLVVKAADSLLKNAFLPIVRDAKLRFAIFLLSALSLCMLTGFVLPSLIINSSVIEFADIDGYGNPLSFLGNSTLQTLGLFVFWASCVYFLFHEKAQTLIAVFMNSILLVALVNAFCFSGKYGNLSRIVTFDSSIPQPSPLVFAMNLAVAALAFILPLLILKTKRPKILTGISSVILLAQTGIILIHSHQIHQSYSSYKKNISSEIENADTLEPVYHMTKTGRNVFVFMMDRAENSYVQPIFQAYPELNDSFDGFKLYHNTASYNAWTLIGSPPLYGGYEYTPVEMNKRDSEKLVDKHNEALLLLPRIFSEQADFSATVSDLSWANYNWIADMSICDAFPKINGFNTERKYTGLWIKQNPDKVQPNITSRALKRNLVWFSLFKCAPTFMRDSIYKDGKWWSSDASSSDIMDFIDYYSVLDFLPELTDFSAQGDSYFTIVNETTHSESELQAPDFVPAMKITQRAKEPLADYRAISSNLAMYKRLAEWLDYLKENDCYDNSRIILVSDHGIGSFDGAALDFWGGLENGYNPDHLHPLLLVKDFGAHGKLNVSEEFMTNADVPAIALKGIVENPVNPNTGKEIREIPPEKKRASGVTIAHNWRPGANNINTYRLSDEDFYTISNNIFKAENWQKGIK
ncbi:MAG: YidC/Oxa1 family membrane protein insertase [Treponema sp.]|nr:YidC/Oxa1 family membrane protein insertase [Treponema sp.]